MRDADLYNALDGIGARPIETGAFRHISQGRDCRSGEGARAFGGRWNPPSSFPVLYTSLTPEGAVAELTRLAERQRRRPAEFLPRILCELRASLSRVVDLTSPETLKRLGVKLRDDPDDLAASQAVGRVAHQLGFEGLLVPSIAGSHTNLVIFELNVTGSVEERGTRTWKSPDDLRLT